MSSNSRAVTSTLPEISLGVKKSNVQLLLIGCNLKNLQDGMKECLRFVKRDLDIQNCMSYLTFAVEENIQPMISLVASYIWDRVDKIKGMPEFMNLKSEDIRALVPKPGMQLHWEKRYYPDKILVGIYVWMRGNVNDRLEHFVDISTKFPLELVDPEVLREIYRKDPDLKEKETCIKLYINAIEGKLFEARQGLQSGTLTAKVRRRRDTDSSDSSTTQEGSNYTTLVSPQSHISSAIAEERPHGNSEPSAKSHRKRVSQIEDDEVGFLEIVPVKKNVTAEIDLTDVEPTEAKAKLYFVNGKAQRQLYSMSLPDFTLEVVAHFPLQDGFKCVFIMSVSGLVVVVCSDQKGAQTIRKLDLETKEWVESRPMLTPRINAAWAVVNGSIYVAGGNYNTGKLRQSMLHFPVTLTPLKCGCDMIIIPESTSSHAMAELCGKLFMVGGVKKRKVTQLCSSSVHSFHPGTKMWKRNKPMLMARAGLCLALVGTKLYAIGGANGIPVGGRGRTCEVYDANNRDWTIIAPLIQPRRDASAFVFEDKIYVVGGNQGSPTMEFYDAQKDTWTLVKNSNLPLDGQYNAVAFASV